MPWVANEELDWKGETLEPGDIVYGLEGHRHRHALVERDKVRAVPPENGECAFVAKKPIQFRGQHYDVGEPIPDVREYSRWKRLLDTGKITAAPPHLKDDEYNEEEVVRQRADRFHKGGGVFDIPGHEEVIRGEDNAVDILRGKA